MKFTRLIGRIFLALLFVNAGLSQLNNTDPFVQFVNVRYPFFYDYVQKLTGHSLDCTEILKPTNFIKHTPCLIQTIGAAQLILGLGVGIGMQGAGCLLALLSIIITVFAHNPIIYLNNVNAQAEYLNIIFNFGIIGALFLVGKRRKNKGSCGVGSCLTKPKEDKKDEKKEDKKDEKKKDKKDEKKKDQKDEKKKDQKDEKKKDKKDEKKKDKTDEKKKDIKDEKKKNIKDEKKDEKKEDKKEDKIKEANTLPEEKK